MMTNGDMPTRNLADAKQQPIDANLAGHVSICSLLEAQDSVPTRSLPGRIFGVSPLSRETKALYQRVVGEIEVGEILESLGSEWIVLHALPMDPDPEPAEIDHLVIGPAGVFAIATKNHSGLDVWASERTFMAEGIRYPYIRNLEYEIGAAERMLSAAAGRQLEISGILAIVTPKSLEVPDEHRDVAVVPAADLVQWLGRQPRILAKREVTSIAAAASLATTWFPADSREDTPELVRIAFDRLRSEVRGARRIQLAWVTGSSVVLVGGFAFVTYSILINAFTIFGN
jgi:Nuclease-related domain